MKRFAECLIAAAVAIALTVSWERWDRDTFVSNRVDDLLAVELQDLERYVETLRPDWVRAQKFGELAEAICKDPWAAPQVNRVRDEMNRKGGQFEPVCGE